MDDFGLPPRPPTSQRLWQHLLSGSKDSGVMPPEFPRANPPLAPIDKTSTSMRILLHDTQTNFEKFSGRVDTLILNVDETKRDIREANNQFQRGHDTLLGDIVDLINRSQTHIQNSVGEPAQARNLEEFTKDVTRQLHDLDKRMDSMHLVSQTLNQIMQTHLQAVHTLQEQQGSMLTALMPLLPLLQSVPLHIDAAKNQILEALSKSSSGNGLRLCSEGDSSQGKETSVHRKRSRSPEDSEETLVSSSTPKRPRTGSGSQPLMAPIDLRSAHEILSQRSNQGSSSSPLFEKRFDASSESYQLSDERTYDEVAHPVDENPLTVQKTPQRPLCNPPAAFSASWEKTILPLDPLVSLARSTPRMSTITTPRLGGAPGHPPELTRTLSAISNRSNTGGHIKLSRVDSAILNSLGKKRTSPTSSRPVSAATKDTLIPPLPPPHVPVQVVRTPLRRILPRTATTIGATPTPRILERMPKFGGPSLRGSVTPVSATARFVRQNREDRPSSREGRRFIPLIDSDDEDGDRTDA
ncbi:hypothetical protein BDN72DRAFT_837812 [Pluteus cervinus]|uniref:Uncharacterized protein n=1 Tax=Pluteus cervinus TaxID=181527 RepID=A0ACD3B2C5_9AGAR|nr:hypothetical protein BDN72DRAFT_837812 [Pluteus cervinus]